MNIGDSILSLFRILFFPPFLEPSIFFSKSPHWRKSYTGQYKVQDFTSPQGNLTASLLLPVSLAHSTAMSIFPFHIYISSSTSFYLVATVTVVTFLNPHLDVSREMIPGQQRFHFIVMGLQYRLHQREGPCTLIFNLFIHSTYLFLIFKSAVCSSEHTAPNFMIIYQSV